MLPLGKILMLPTVALINKLPVIAFTTGVFTLAAEVILPVALIKPPVNTLPPVMLAAEVIVLVALIRPPVNKLPPVTLPFALNSPVMYSPVVANTATLDVPLTLTVTLALAAAMFTLDVPLLMLATDVIMPVKK